MKNEFPQPTTEIQRWLDPQGQATESSRYLEAIESLVIRDRTQASKILSDEIKRIDHQKGPDFFFADSDTQKTAVFNAVMDALDRRSALRQEWIHAQKQKAIDHIGKAA